METILKKKKSMFNRRSKSETIVMAIAFVIMLFHICAILYVFLYGVNLSLKWDQDSYLDPEKRNALSIFFDKEKRTILNHRPILGLHNGFISFDGFLWAWSNNQLRHAPIILQILDSDEAHQSYLRLRALFE
jgi:hypothetical protein